MSVPLRELCSVIRSKQAGPFRLTLDMVFKDKETYARVREAGALSPEAVAAQYGVSPDQVTRFVFYDPANAVKVSLVRPHVAGSLGDGDMYGCQQHVPLLDLSLDLEEVPA